MLRTRSFAVLAFALSLPPFLSAQQVYYPGNGVTLPAVVKEVHLMGPSPATVGIECVVESNGAVTNATIASSPDSRLNEAALRALRQWRFQPGTRSGAPVAVRVFVEIAIEPM